MVRRLAFLFLLTVGIFSLSAGGRGESPALPEPPAISGENAPDQASPTEEPSPGGDSIPVDNSSQDESEAPSGDLPAADDLSPGGTASGSPGSDSPASGNSTSGTPGSDSPAPADSYIVQSRDEVIFVDAPGWEIIGREDYGWYEEPGTGSSPRLWCWNSMGNENCTLDLPIRLPGPGYYELYMLHTQENNVIELNMEYNDLEENIWSKKELTDGKWQKFGTIPFEIRTPDIRIRIGNSIPANDRSWKVSFEALRIVKVGDLPSRNPDSSSHASSDDFIVHAGSPGIRLEEPEGFEWSRAAGIEYPERLVTYNRNWGPYSTITLDIELPSPGRYKIHYLNGPEDSYAPELTFRTTDGWEQTRKIPSNNSRSAGEWWSPVEWAIPDTSIQLELSNNCRASSGDMYWLKNDMTAAISFEAIRFERVSDLAYKDRREIAAGTSDRYVKEVHSREEVLARWEELKPRYSGPLYVERPGFQAPYQPGVIEPAYLQEALDMLNFHRYLYGVGADLELDEVSSGLNQHGSVVSAVNGRISHFPERIPGMAESFWDIGNKACLNSNLTQTFDPPHMAAYSLVADIRGGASHNIGHRASLFKAEAVRSGIGFVRHDGYTWANVDIGFNGGETGVFEYDYLVWPNEGFFPLQFMNHKSFHLVPWSVDLSNSKFIFDHRTQHMAKIEVRKIPAPDSWEQPRTWQFHQLTGGDIASGGLYFGNGVNGGISFDLAFRPDDLGELMEGDRFDVKITGLYDTDRQPVSIEYSFELIDLPGLPYGFNFDFTE